MKKAIDFESVLSLIDKAISPSYLNPTQEIVLREVWNGKTYSKMAYDYNYDPEYIKSVGCNLWQTLSRAFDEHINKSNFVPFMRQKIAKLVEDKIEHSQEYQVPPLSTKTKGKKFCNWTTAPHTKHFVGREEEMGTLKSWSQDLDCRFIIVSGMIGCGKTTLATKFAEKIENQFDYVIWFSLLQPPPLTTLLNSYLKTISQHSEAQIEQKSLGLSFLLSEFIDCLKQQRILLILDGLQYIFNVNRTNISYKKGFEEYGQFLRSIITTDHQSLLIATSRLKPRLLEYYTSNQVKFLELKGLKVQNTRIFLKLENNSSIKEQKLLSLSATLQSNPQLLKIIHNHLDGFSEENTEQIVQDLSLLEEISNLLEQELSYLSDLDKEIIYWLSISCFPMSLEELNKHVEQSQPKLKFLQSVNSLVKRSLIIKRDATYSLMLIMKVYLRRKLVKQAIKSENSISIPN